MKEIKGNKWEGIVAVKKLTKKKKGKIWKKKENETMMKKENKNKKKKDNVKFCTMKKGTNCLSRKKIKEILKK